MQIGEYKLTGRTKYHAVDRWFRDYLIVLQVEVTKRVEDTKNCMEDLVMLTYWKNANINDLLKLNTLENKETICQ